MTSQGSLHGQFGRAVARRDVYAALALAHELGGLELPDALALVLLLADKEPRRFERAAARWHARFVLEARGIGVAESQLALGAVAALCTGAADEALGTLVALGRRHGVPNLRR